MTTTSRLCVGGFAKYAAYSDSGVKWIGYVPEHWEVKRLKWSKTGTINGVWGDEPDGENDIPCIRVGDFDRRKFRVNFDEPTQRAVTPTQRVGRELRTGDLLLEKSGGGDKQMVGCVVLYDHDEPAVSSNFIARISVAPAESPPYWTYVHAALYSGKLNYLAIKQTTGIQNLDQDVYFDTLAGFPPLVEQEAVAAFLDRETERIDALIDKKRLLIERLQEYRTALITRTVTRGLPPEAASAAGLDPEPRLKPSGVEWLGDVPEHWEVKQLRRAVLLQRGHDLPTDEREFGDIPIVSSAGVSGSHALAAAQGPAVVTGRYGSIGEFHLVEGPYWPLNTTLYTIDLYGNEVRFIRYLLMNLKPLFLVNAAKSAVPGVDRNDLHVVSTAVPPLAEQQAIADYLDSRLSRVCNAAASVERFIERLQEYRTALTSRPPSRVRSTCENRQRKI